MKRVLSIILIVLCISLSSSAGFAEEPKSPMMGQEGMMQHRGKMMGMCPMHRMMAKMMMEKSLVATDDGGVVVLAGDQLLKYDKNLDLKKEVEIKVDIQDKMAGMTERCPMCKGMMGMGQPVKKGVPE